MKSWWMFVLLIGLMGCMSVDDPVVEVRLQDGDVVETAVSANAAIFDIYSQTGIGRAEVMLVKGAWPEKILLRLHLRGLEEFKFAYAETVITANVSSTGAASVREMAVVEGEERPLTTDSPHNMPIHIQTENGETTIPLENGYFEIEAPVDFTTGPDNNFTISWIDFYR